MPVIVVLERPSILEFTSTATKTSRTKDLEKVLTENGLTRGQDVRPLDSRSIDAVADGGDDRPASMRRAPRPPSSPSRTTGYGSRSDRRGRSRKDRQAMIVGNTSFEEEEIIADFELSTGNCLSFIRQQRSLPKEALEGDLDELRSNYMDRGFADFARDDVRVSISPDKRDIFVTISIAVSDRYMIPTSSWPATWSSRKSEFPGLILAAAGDTFTRRADAKRGVHALRLGQDGMRSAEIRAVPELDEDEAGRRSRSPSIREIAPMCAASTSTAPQRRRRGVPCRAMRQLELRAIRRVGRQRTRTRRRASC